MSIKNKVFQLNAQFTKELPTSGDVIDNIFISGYASVNVPDRAGDVVPSGVWEKGMGNYLKNPIILAFHDNDDPIGRMVEHKVDSKGLWIKARISAAAEETFNLIKDGVLTAFSVAFRVIDAEYNAVTELFVIKELELVEISVVSVPCNQDTLFSLSKSFDNTNDYELFKQQFAPKGNSAKGLESKTEAKSNNLKGIGMDPKELQAMLETAATNAATLATKSLLDAQKADAELKAKALADEAAMQERINKAIAAVTPSTTGAEKLMADIEKRFADQAESSKSAIAGLEAILKEKASELDAIQKSKMSFANGKSGEATDLEKEKAVILGKITGKGYQATKYFTGELVQKYGQHLPSATWELEVSMNMEAEVRRKLVVAPNLRNISMQTNVMSIPVNPEAGLANWVTNANFGAVPGSLGAAGPSAGGSTVTTGNTPGVGSPHALKEITLNAYKVATNEYVAYEEEEDSLLVLMPIIRDAMVRRTARALDRAFLLGAGAGADPVKGLATYNATSATAQFVSLAGGAASTNVLCLRNMRRALGAQGLDPAEVIYIVSQEVYYNLLDDTVFQTMNQVGPQATLLTGQIGQIGGSPVLVSGEFPSAAAGTNVGTTNIAAVAFNPNNFIVGNQRGLRFDTQDLVETQRKVLVASIRTGMTQIATNLGSGAVTLRYNT